MTGRGTGRRVAQVLCCLCALAFGFVLAGAASAPRAPNPDPRPPSSPPAPPSPPATPVAPPTAPPKPPVTPPQTPPAPPAPPQVPTVVEVQGGRQSPPVVPPVTETTPTETTPTETTDSTQSSGSTVTLTYSQQPPPSDQPGSRSFTAQPARLLLLGCLILAESFVIVRLFRRDVRSLAIGIAIAVVGAGLIVYGLGA